MSSDISLEKKLKQSRLPFSPVDPKTQKKRKLSTESESRSSKVLCSESPSTSKRKNDKKSPLKEPVDINIKDDSNHLEEKENIKNKFSEPKLNDCEKSNDSIIEIDSLKNKDINKSPKKEQNKSESAKLIKSPILQEEKNAEPKNKAKRKRTSSAKTESSSNTIKKMFMKKDISPKISTVSKIKSEDKNDSENVENNKLKETICLISDDEESLAPESEKSDSTKDQNQSDSAKLDDCSIQKQNAGPKSKGTKRRKSTGKIASSSNTIKKMFKDDDVKSDTSLKVSIATKSESENKDSDTSTKETSISNSDNEESTEPELEKSGSTNTTNSSLSQSEVDSEAEKSKPLVVKTPLPKKSVTHIRKLTSKQKLIQERAKQNQEEKLKLKQEKRAERQKQQDEKQKKKLEEQEAKEKEKEEKKQKKEEERLKKEEEKLKKEEEKQKKEEEKQKKEEEKQKKEEEKQKKEEEKLLAEEEEKEKQKKLKEKFAQFFVPKKVEMSPAQKEEALAADNFVHFRIKENMKIAPLVRSSLTEKQKQNLEKILKGENKENTLTYLKEIKKKIYKKGKSFQTFPSFDKTDGEEDDCEIISDEEIDGTDVLEVKSSQNKIVRAKFLKFCENSRPAYYGTWSKKPTNLTGRKPFAKEEIFDYDYDSDEDWEDIENGESLSDSDGEADEGNKEEINQYEVDNEFFVPHGYLSDGEGEDDEESEATAPPPEEEEDKEKGEKDKDFQKEKLKQKQEEFELEMKQQTKHLKPKVFGCVWLGDKSSHKAYDQLLKLLLPHRSVVMFGSCPIDINSKDSSNQELKDDDDETHEDESTKKFVKSFPDAAVPDLIRLIHGNRHSKLFLMREFNEYWKKKQEAEVDSATGFIAMRKIEPKIQEIGQYGRFTENGISFKYRTWYVAKEIREKYGLEDLSLNNTWNFTLPVKEWKKDESKEEKQDENNEEQIPKSQTKPPFTGTNLITKFTKVLNAEEEKKKFSISSPGPSASEVSSPDVGKTPKSNVGKSPMITPKSSVKKSNSKNIVSATKSTVTPTSVSKEKPEISKPKNSIMAMFKNMEKGRKNVGKNSSSEQEDDLGCITLD